MENVRVGLSEDPQGKGAESFHESLNKLIFTLRKKSGETCYSIVDSKSVTISLRMALIESGIVWLSILLIFNFLKIISVIFSQIYS